jgi:hypothetical protein
MIYSLLYHFEYRYGHLLACSLLRPLTVERTPLIDKTLHSDHGRLASRRAPSRRAALRLLREDAHPAPCVRP